MRRQQMVMMVGGVLLSGCVSEERLASWLADEALSDTDGDSLPVVDTDTEFGGDTDTEVGGDTDTTEVDCPAGMEEVPAQTFQMGCTAGQSDCYERESPVTTVTLTRSFCMDATEVTQEMYEGLMGSNPSYFSSCGADCPVEEVSWHDAALYANARSTAEGLSTCFVCASDECEPSSNYLDCSGYRLATEAEWEAAARCGEDLLYAGSDTSNEVAWTSENEGAATHPAGQLAANACGLFDMSGNVWEWTLDWYGEYPGGSVSDPVGAQSGSVRVYRGGSWYYVPQHARVAVRYSYSPGYRDYRVGFRLVRTLP